MLTFEPITAYPKGTLHAQLFDAYSFSSACLAHWNDDWREYDSFMYSNPQIANACGFVSVLNGQPIGHVTWDPRHIPDYAILGHNCILTAYKGHGYGKAQLHEAIRRLRMTGVQKIIVTTNELLLPAQRNYESAGFIKVNEWTNDRFSFAGNLIDYELIL